MGGVIRPWLRGRKADPGAQLDLFNYVSTSTKDLQDEIRVVVTNHGPADMKKVAVELFDVDGKSLALAEPDISDLWPKMPFECLHANQSLYLTLNRSGITRDTRGVEIKWHDGRTQEQSRRIGLSYHRMT